MPLLLTALYAYNIGYNYGEIICEKEADIYVYKIEK